MLVPASVPHLIWSEPGHLHISLVALSVFSWYSQALFSQTVTTTVLSVTPTSMSQTPPPGYSSRRDHRRRPVPLEAGGGVKTGISQSFPPFSLSQTLHVCHICLH